MDTDGIVVSLPPITNAENTKVRMKERIQVSNIHSIVEMIQITVYILYITVEPSIHAEYLVDQYDHNPVALTLCSLFGM